MKMRVVDVDVELPLASLLKMYWLTVRLTSLMTQEHFKALALPVNLAMLPTLSGAAEKRRNMHEFSTTQRTITTRFRMPCTLLMPVTIGMTVAQVSEVMHGSKCSQKFLERKLEGHGRHRSKCY